MSLQCPACKETIDDDALHCDQCGTELRRCSKCGRLGTKARCSIDGAPLVSLKTVGGVATATLATPATPVMSAPLPGNTTPASVAAAAPIAGTARIATGAPNLRLLNGPQGVDVRPASGALIGRGAGPHVDVFSRFPQISTRHLELRRDDSGVWWAKDVGSFNHSFFNGVKLAPQQEQVLTSGGILTLADLALTVFIE